MDAITSYQPNLYIQCKEYLRSIKRDPKQLFMHKQIRNCSCCGYIGKFISMRSNYREARCPNCASRERDRLFYCYINANNISLDNKTILHFSPEPYLFRKLKHNPNYISGDIKKSKYAHYHVNITHIDYPDNHFDFIICNHVLEHVNEDHKALQECFRVLKPHGIAFFSVPYYPDREETFEPPASMPQEEVERICGWDHKRLYGQDFIERIRNAGFQSELFLLKGEVLEKYKTGKDPIFVSQKA